MVCFSSSPRWPEKLARRIGLPAVIRYLLVGVIVSPFTPGYVANREQLSILADVGVVLLLFEVGIEINPLRLAREGRRPLLLSPPQVVVTWAISGAVCLALGMRPAGAALVGLSIAMSSSVVAIALGAGLISGSGGGQCRRLLDPRSHGISAVSAGLVRPVVTSNKGEAATVA